MKEKYDEIGIGYNLTRKPDKFLVNKFLNHLSPSEEKLYLDIGCGTGNYTVALQKLGVNLIGVDPSDEMLSKAQAKSENIQWIKGKAEAIPLENDSVDGIMASLTIHHWKDLALAFKELSRVLRKNGKIVIFTSTPEQMEGYWLNHYFLKMLEDSIVQMPSLQRVERNMLDAGLKTDDTEKYFIHEDLEDLFLYSGKHNPSSYLNHQVRHGISSFSSLANSCEIKQGLHELEVDIATGKINDVINKYENDKGDYLFIMGSKR